MNSRGSEAGAPLDEPHQPPRAGGHRASWVRLVKRYYIEFERCDWVEAADRFKGVESIFHLNRIRTLRRLLDEHDQGNLTLDLGCGTGFILRCTSPVSIGLDINPWAINRAKMHAPGKELVIGDAEITPFRARVVCTEVLEHLPEPESSLNEINKSLRHNGRLIGSVPHRNPIWQLRFLSSTCPHSELFHNEYKRKEIAELLSNFKVAILKTSTFKLNIIFVANKDH